MTDLDTGAPAVPATNAELLERYMSRVWNGGEWDTARALVSDEMVVHGAGGQVVKQGPEGVIGLVTAWRNAFPDGRMVVHEYLSEGELVADRMTWEGTHSGEFYGIAPTGATVSCTSIGTDRIVGGIITEGWGELDMLGMMQQLGALPALFPPTSGAWDDDGPTCAAPGAPAHAETVRTLAVRTVQRLGAADDAGLTDVVDADAFVDHNPTTGRTGLAGTRAFAGRLREALPDVTWRPSGHTVVDGDRALVRWTAGGKHTGAPLMGVEATGLDLSWTGSDILRVQGGRCVERWTCADLFSVAQQLGVMG